jgi:hypothetical protein
MTGREAFDELCAYTLTRGDETFIHQHVVDAFAAQSADECTAAIKLTFALAGLYLHVEQNFTGREGQRVHMQMGRSKRIWPSFTIPCEHGSITAADVLSRSAGVERDQAIHAWSVSVWKAFRANKRAVEELLSHYPQILGG